MSSAGLPHRDHGRRGYTVSVVAPRRPDHAQGETLLRAYRRKRLGSSWSGRDVHRRERITATLKRKASSLADASRYSPKISHSGWSPRRVCFSLVPVVPVTG